MVIKLNTPWTIDLYNRIPNSGGVINFKGIDYKFEINNEADTCDAWIVWGGLNDSIDKLIAVCSSENIFFITDERFDGRKYNTSFLAQFNYVITGRADINHKGVINSHELNTWLLNKSFHDVCNIKFIEKSKSISVVSSDLTWLPGHKKRFAFVNRMIGHFKDRLDVYGRGFNEISDKWDALYPYKYSIAIENNSLNGYFTEKISECYLAHVMPIYFGAPDIEMFFSGDTLLKIDLDDYKNGIRKIERLLEEDPYSELLEKIVQQKKIYLEKYHFFQAVSNILHERIDPKRKYSKSKIKIRAEKCFDHNYSLKRMIRFFGEKLP